MGVLSLLCNFHLMQAIERKLVSLYSDEAVRKDILDIIRRLKTRTLESEFKHDLQLLNKPEYSEFYNAYFDPYYLCTNTSGCRLLRSDCLCVAKLWSDFGTRKAISGREHDETTNMIESFFRKSKYDFLSKRSNRRMSDLHILILKEMMPHYAQQMSLKYARRIRSKHQERAAKRSQIVDLIRLTTDAMTWSDKAVGIAKVISQTTKGAVWTICLAELSCTCPWAEKDDVLCKHLEAGYRSLRYNVSFTYTYNIRMRNDTCNLTLKLTCVSYTTKLHIV
jgi:hypothetical protein